MISGTAPVIAERGGFRCPSIARLALADAAGGRKHSCVVRTDLSRVEMTPGPCAVVLRGSVDD